MGAPGRALARRLAALIVADAENARVREERRVDAEKSAAVRALVSA